MGVLELNIMKVAMSGQGENIVNIRTSARNPSGKGALERGPFPYGTAVPVHTD